MVFNEVIFDEVIFDEVIFDEVIDPRFVSFDLEKVFRKV
jgi:hypothetical protein